MTEAKLQAQIIKYLKDKGCYVIKTRPGGGTSTGCPDIIFLLEGFWGALEIKKISTAKWQPLQKETITKLDKWSYAKVVFFETWPDIKQELETML